jgi:hypothetical protein
MIEILLSEWAGFTQDTTNNQQVNFAVEILKQSKSMSLHIKYGVNRIVTNLRSLFVDDLRKVDS